MSEPGEVQPATQLPSDSPNQQNQSESVPIPEGPSPVPKDEGTEDASRILTEKFYSMSFPDEDYIFAANWLDYGEHVKRVAADAEQRQQAAPGVSDSVSLSCAQDNDKENPRDAEGRRLVMHFQLKRSIVAASSLLLRKELDEQPDERPIFLNNVLPQTLGHVVQYIQNGTVVGSVAYLEEFINVTGWLRIGAVWPETFAECIVTIKGSDPSTIRRCERTPWLGMDPTQLAPIPDQRKSPPAASLACVPGSPEIISTEPTVEMPSKAQELHDVMNNLPIEPNSSRSEGLLITRVPIIEPQPIELTVNVYTQPYYEDPSSDGMQQEPESFEDADKMATKPGDSDQPDSEYRLVIWSPSPTTESHSPGITQPTDNEQSDDDNALIICSPATEPPEEPNMEYNETSSLEEMPTELPAPDPGANEQSDDVDNIALMICPPPPKETDTVYSAGSDMDQFEEMGIEPPSIAPALPEVTPDSLTPEPSPVNLPDITLTTSDNISLSNAELARSSVIVQAPLKPFLLPSLRYRLNSRNNKKGCNRQPELKASEPTENPQSFYDRIQKTCTSLIASIAKAAASPAKLLEKPPSSKPAAAPNIPYLDSVQKAPTLPPKKRASNTLPFNNTPTACPPTGPYLIKPTPIHFRDLPIIPQQQNHAPPIAQPSNPAFNFPIQIPPPRKKASLPIQQSYKPRRCSTNPPKKPHSPSKQIPPSFSPSLYQPQVYSQPPPVRKPASAKSHPRESTGKRRGSKYTRTLVPPAQPLSHFMLPAFHPTFQRHIIHRQQQQQQQIPALQKPARVSFYEPDPFPVSHTSFIDEEPVSSQQHWCKYCRIEFGTPWDLREHYMTH